MEQPGLCMISVLERSCDFGYYVASVACELAPACGPVREHLWVLWKASKAALLVPHLCGNDGTAKSADRRNQKVKRSCLVLHFMWEHGIAKPGYKQRKVDRGLLEI